MGFLICIQRKGRARVLAFGNTLKVLTMASTVFKTAIEKVSNGENITMDKSEKFVLESMKESVKL